MLCCTALTHLGVEDRCNEYIGTVKFNEMHIKALCLCVCVHNIIIWSQTVLSTSITSLAISSPEAPVAGKLINSLSATLNLRLERLSGRSLSASR